METNPNLPTNTTLSQWPTLHAYRVLVTPEMAAEWLKAGNIDNRGLRRSVVNRYADMMKRGEWKPTHQGVAFSKRRLIDGQHRLSAVVASGRAQWMVVFVEQDDDVFGVLDRGTARGLRDDLRMEKTVVDAVSFLSRLYATDNSLKTQAPIDKVRRVVDVFLPYLNEMVEKVNITARGRSTAAMRAAVALRLATAIGADREYVLDMWRAWLLLDVDGMSTSIKSALKRLDGVAAADGGIETKIDRACIGWVAFDPRNKELQRIQINNHTKQLNEMRAAFLNVMGAM